jgi:DNA-binding IclR family transcriptional regulator
MKAEGVSLGVSMCDEPTRREGVLERVTAIMDVFATGRRFAYLEDVSATSGIPRSTTFRLLRQLVQLGWLDHDDRGYRLGRRAQTLRGPANDYTDLRAAASAVLNDLSLRTGAVCHLGVLEGSNVHCLDKVGGAAAASIPSRVGARIGAERTVTGRALLARLRPEQVDELLVRDRDEPERLGHQAMLLLHDDLNRVRRGRGIAFSAGDRCLLGISSVAAPVIGPEGAVAAISVAARRLISLDKMAPLVARAARQTSEQLYPGWQSSHRHLVAAAM